MTAETKGRVEVEPPLVRDEATQRFRQKNGLVRPTRGFGHDHISSLFAIFLYAGATILFS